MDTNKKLALKELRRIKHDGVPRGRYEGICGNVAAALGELSIEVSKLLMPLYKTWPYYSGNLWYPVPHPDRMGHAKSAQFIYSDTAPLWDASLPYGRLRWKLVDWLIYKLEQEEASDANP